MQPAAALIAYTFEGEYRHREYYLELRSIGKDGLMGAGKPVNVKFIRLLMENFSAVSPSVPHGELPKGMLYADVRAGKYVWYRPPCRKYLYFSSVLNIPNGEYSLPGLVWTVRDESLYMFAYRAKRLSSGTQLYSAPFFNVRPCTGSVCMGNAKSHLPEILTFNGFIKYWEDRFFLSEFSHILGSNPTRNNLILVLKKSVHSFDRDELTPVKKLKLKDLLK